MSRAGDQPEISQSGPAGTPPGSASETATVARSGVSWRALAIGLVLVVIVCFVVCWSELIITRIQIGFLQMPPVAMGLFFFIVLANGQMRKISRRLGLRAAELLMIYCMMVVAAMISSRGVMEKVIPMLVTPNYYANSSNRWQELFFPNTPKWMVAFDPEGPPGQEVAKGFFEGLRDGGTIPWNEWAVPLATWGLLVLLVIFAFLCLATLLRRQWVDNEKLSFPLVQPPLELVRETKEPILHNKLLWAGIAVPGIVFTLNGIHNYIPAVPEIKLDYLINPLLVNPPWNAMYYTSIFVSFAAIGFFFLLPSDLLFSVWFFAIFARLQGVAAASFGMELPRMPVYGTHLFVAYQTAGAYFVLVGYLLYAAMPHLRQVWRAVVHGDRTHDDEELMPYRTAFWGLVLSFVLILWWCWMAGMSMWVACLQFGVFIFVIAIIMARSTAEAGMLMTETTFRPVDIFRMFAPVSALGPQNLTMLAYMDGAFLRDQRGLLLTGFFDGLKLTDGAHVRRRSFLPVFILAILAAMVVAGYLHIAMPYDRGGITMYETVYSGHNLAPFRDYSAHMLNTEHIGWQAPVFFVVGMIVTALLSYMRTMFFWWPLHPLGYALSVSWTVSVFWFAALVAWIVKSAVLRYGGMKLYAQARPFFLGMVLGEFGTAVIWALIGIATNVPTPLYPWP